MMPLGDVASMLWLRAAGMARSIVFVRGMSMERNAKTLCIMVCTLLSGAASMAYCPDAATQPVRVTPGSGDDLRAAYADAADVAEGKRLADASCASCHGTNGISATKGVPHLAGQRPAYLHLELRAYQSGARGDSAMNHPAVKFLNDDALVKVAAYYASLDPAQPAAATAAKAAPAKPDAIEAGKAAVASCTGCHGESGITKTPGMPNLVGFDPKYLVATMKAYKSGQYKSEVMKTILANVSDAEMDNIALYYALQKPARAQTPAPGDQAAGKGAAAAACAGCHGEAGVSTDPAIPSLAGQDAQYLATALKAYKDGLRSDATMKFVVASLDDRAAKDLAAFYAAQQPRPVARKRLSAAEWAQRCDRCHGVDGNSTDPRTPALAAQRADYLERVLHAYQTGARKSVAMAAMSGVLTDADVENLAAHYARQKARAVVYVMLPAK
jgi:cytochrome c553